MANGTNGRGAAKVTYEEIDLTTRISGLNGLYVGIIVESERGQVTVPRLIQSQTAFLTNYTSNGNSIPVGSSLSMYDAIDYLASGNQLQVLRVVGQNALYAGALTGATVTLTGILQSTEEATASTLTHAPLSTGIVDPSKYTFDPNDTSEMLIYAKDIGAVGNRVSYTMAAYPKNPLLKAITVFFDGVQQGNILYFSRDESLKDANGNATFCEIVINRSSYIGCVNNPNVVDTQLPTDTNGSVTLGGGASGLAVTDGDRISALDKFKSKEGVSLTLFSDGGNSTVPYQQAVIQLVESRRDSVAILNCPFEAGAAEDPIQAAIDYRDSTLIDSSWGAMYSPHVQIYDRWNDRNLWVPPSGFVCGCFAKAQQNNQAWYPIGGEVRGLIEGVQDVQVHYTSVEGGDLDQLVNNQVNPIYYTQTKIMIWGQETLQQADTHLSDLHVRMALIYMEQPAVQALSTYNWDFNDVGVRLTITNTLTSLLQRLTAANAFNDFKIVCDDTNNTADDVDNDQLNVWIFVKPKGYNKFIKLSVIITPNNMSWDTAATIAIGDQ